MSNTSASKTRSLTMTLMMVLMALSPMASVEADHDENWFGDYELHVDGTLYDEVEVLWPSDVEILSCTQNSWDDGWNCEIDIDGDGSYNYPDYTMYFQYCDDSTGSWVCVVDNVDPLMEEGNYSLEYYVSGLDPDTNYTANIYVYVYDFNEPLSFYNHVNQVFESDSNGEISIELDELYWEVSNSTCSGYSDFRLNWVDNGTEALRNQDNFIGWCDGELAVTTELDGEEYEMIPHYSADVVDCERHGGFWFCSLDEQGNDGEADRFMVRFDLDRCEEDSNGEWVCIQHTQNPLIWPGDHTIEWMASGLPDSSWRMMTSVYAPDGDIYEDVYFNGTSESVDTDFTTDWFTCGLGAHYILYEGEWVSGSWSTFGTFEANHYNWQGPCDEEESTLTLFMDSEEYVENPVYEEFDECIEDGFDHECWNDDYDYDEDGEPDWTRRHMQDCEEDNSTGTWTCIVHYDRPLVWPGDHSFELLIDEIEDGEAYQISGNFYANEQGSPSYNEQVSIYFNGTSSGDHTETWDWETFESTCSLNYYLDVRHGYWNSDGDFQNNGTQESENFYYNGPCETPDIFTLTVDGEEYEVEYNMDYFDHCEQDGFNWLCWNDDWDENSDGEPDWTSHQNDCEEDNSTGEWYCINEWNFERPEIEEGNHTMELTIDVEDNMSYGLTIGVNICQNMGGCDNENTEFEFNTTSDTETITFYVETDNYTCSVDLNIQRYNIDWDDNGNSWRNNHIYDYFNFNGPCEQPPSPFTLTADGVEWEEQWNYQTFDECDEDPEGDGYECWNEGWDWTNYYEDCEELSDGSWECAAWWNNPEIEPGNHTMVLTVDNLDVGTNYSVSISANICENMAGCEHHDMDFEFNATAETMSETFHMETTEYTCSVNIYVNLHEEMDWGSSHMGSDSFNYNGPCEQPPSPFTLTYDGVEWEEQWNYQTFDECDEDPEGDGYECWNEGWSGTNYYEDCEELSDGSWECAAWWSDPDIEPGNHTMELTIEDLDVGTNYSVSISANICENMAGCEHHDMEFEFNATAETMSETFHMETTEYTCNVNIYVNLHEEMDWGSSHMGSDSFNYNGPCEQPPSPFTLTYDGVEWEEQWNYQTFDECDEDPEGDGYECWNEGWDWTNYYEDCEELSDGSWECPTWWSDPDIEPGNHTMELTIEDLDVGTNYSVSISANICENMAGCEHHDMEFEFNATAETMSETFHMETTEYTCNVNIYVNLHEEMDWGFSHMGSDSFNYNGPCEEPPSPFTLTYDGVEWEEQWNYQTFDECEEADGDFECWDEGWDWTNYYEDCEELSDGGWECATWWSDPEIEPGNHTMELTIEDLEVGTNYSVEWYFDVCQNTMGCDGDSDQFEFNATAETMSETFHIETDNYTCGMSINVRLYEEMDGWSDEIAYDYFSFNGPCEQPPSPFTLTYDSVEWDLGTPETLEFDHCSADGSSLYCWYDEWDWEGDDGYPEHRMYMPNDYCEDMGTHWECDSPWMTMPEIEPGNHSMELSVEDLVVGTNYSLAIDLSIYGNDGYWDEMEFEFNATAETMSETFYMETDSTTCNVNIWVDLYEMSEDWDRVSSYSYGFQGPCEEYGGSDDVALEYDDGSGAVEWEWYQSADYYDHCWQDGPTNYVCMDDGDDYLSWENDCEELSDGGFDCYEMGYPQIDEAAELGLTWTLEDHEVGNNYTLMWYYCTQDFMGGDYCSYEDQEPDAVNFTTTSGGYSADWEMVIENTTCVVDIEYTILDWGQEEIDWQNGEPQDERGGSFGFDGPCQMEWPVNVILEVDDNGWQEVDGIPIDELMEAFGEDGEEEPSSDEMAEFILSNIGYELSEGNWTMSWTMDDLDVDGDYQLGWSVEMVPGDEDDDEPTFYCGNGDEIPFSWVNDEEQDCPDGADEQQYDDNGDPINWFDCSDGSEVWIYQVNDGVEDCPDGDDEWYYDGDDADDDDDYHNFTSTSDSESLEWELEVTEDVCLIAVQGDLMSIEEHDDGWTDTHTVGLLIAYILGPLAEEDENGDGIPDCLEMLLDQDFGDGEGPSPSFDMQDFAVGEDFSAELVEVVDSDGTAVAAIHQHTTLDDEIRMKIDFDFFDGDGILNDTEAAMFEMQYIEGTSEEGCSEQVPPFSMNGVEPWCATNHVWFDNLANNSDGHSPVMMQGWDLHYNVTVNDEGQMIFHYPGDIVVWGEDTDSLDFDGSLCGGAHDGAGLVVASWSYNGTEMTGNCVEVMAGDYIEEIQIVFGYPDSDGDGYNDFEDRFPDDPEEWSDLDDDGVGDNHDEFPNDPTESNDADGDGVGDNGDAFPWDASESADSDGDGWGDNSDAFPDDSTEWVDTDGDGVGDNADTDADNDGTDDTDEDSDGDGVNDDQDDFPFDANETTDTDGDGVGDNGDDFPDDANETTDTDGDGTGDNSDEDADGDGTPNDLDDFPLNSGESTDSDGDGVGDSEDAFPNNPNEYIDSDGDGVGDNADTDDDNDGTPDTSDVFPLDPSETSDTDGDGYGDVADAFPNDAGEWSDYDGDGVGDNSDAFMSDPYESRDSDGDGVGDNADWAPNDPNEILDSDGDGVGNNADAFPTDASESKDTDDDGIGDNADDDADGDGIPDDGIDPVDDGESGGILPGFTAITGLASVLGAAILVAGRRKD